MTSPPADKNDAAHWRNRRADEADAAGLSAIKTRQTMLAALENGDPNTARAAAAVYGVLIDKAEQLTQHAGAAGVRPPET